MREIGKDGKIWRLTKESWNSLQPWDSDPNVAISKIMKALAEKPAAPTTFSASSHSGGCNFDEKKMQKIVKQAVEDVVLPLTGG